VEIIVRAEVPLADEAGGVAERAQDLGEGLLGGGQTDGGILRAPGEGALVAEALGIAAGDQAGAVGRAVGVGDVGAGKDHAAGGDAVEPGGGDFLGAVEADVAVAELVGEDDDDVGRAGGRGCLESGGQRDEEGREGKAQRRAGKHGGEGRGERKKRRPEKLRPET
jgi:hypothetical protein